MGKAVRSFSSSRDWRLGVVIAGATLALAACATSAPSLPPDRASGSPGAAATIDSFSDHDRAMTCDDVAKEWSDTNAALAANNSAIESNRTQNQVAGYFGAMLIMPLAATDNNDPEKAKIAATYQRRDTLIRLAAAKHCPDLK